MKIILKSGGVWVLSLALASLTALALRPVRTQAGIRSTGMEAPAVAATLAPEKPAANSAFSGPTIYDGTVGRGWLDWSWCKRDLASSERVEAGKTASIRADAKFSEAVYFSHLPASSSAYDRIAIAINGGKAGGQKLVLAAVKGRDANKHNIVYEALQLKPLAPNAWTEVVVPLSRLKAADKPDLGGFWLQRVDKGPTDPFFVSSIRLLTPADAAPGPDSETTRVPGYPDRATE